MNLGKKKENNTLVLEDSASKYESKDYAVTGTNNTKMSQQKVSEQNGSSSREPKRDFFGSIIDKEKKQQHIVFRDILAGKQVADINEVESYKEYNAMDYDEVEEELPPPKCKCEIL